MRWVGPQYHNCGLIVRKTGTYLICPCLFNSYWLVLECRKDTAVGGAPPEQYRQKVRELARHLPSYSCFKTIRNNNC